MISFLNQDFRLIIIILVVAILLTNVGYSYKALMIWLYADTFDGITNEFLKLFQKRDLTPKGLKYKQIGEMLGQQPNITDSYIMATENAYAYYANSKFLFSYFQEGKLNETLNEFITRENWSDYDIYFSNIHSLPGDRYDLNHPIPDYLIYESPNKSYCTERFNAISNLCLFGNYEERVNAIKILFEPNNPKIPPNFELIYHSIEAGVIVYKINHNE